MMDRTETARAFSEGADARLAGRDKRACPYGCTTTMRDQWLRGWESVDTDWGKEAQWKVRTLPLAC